MDGKGRCLDNIFIERLWRSLKYECVYLHAWETGSQARAGVGRWITFYNNQRPHAAHGGHPPAVSTSTRSSPASRGREWLKSAPKLSTDGEYLNLHRCNRHVLVVSLSRERFDPLARLFFQMISFRLP